MHMSILIETSAHSHAVLKIRPDWQELRHFRAAPYVISCFLFILIFLCACTRGGRRPYALLDITPIPVSAPDGFYQDVAWLEPEMLALEFLATKETKTWESRLMILDLATGESLLLPDEVLQDCHETQYGRFDRLPTGQLGYQQECFPLLGIARDFRLHLWDPITQTDQEIYRYPIPFEATAFSFAPNMDRWLQEQTGDGLFNKLYYVETGQVPVRLLETSFARAGWPTWLPDGRIVFAGTPQLPETKPNIFSGAPALMAQLNQPWNIYLTNLESLLHESVGEEQIVLSGIKGIRGPVASPDGRALAFLGTYRGHKGLWVYGMDTERLARVWAGFGPFAWSPDGRELMVLIREPNVEFFLGKPARIKLPDSIISKRPLISVAGVP